MNSQSKDGGNELSNDFFKDKAVRKVYEDKARLIIAEGYDIDLDDKMNIDLVRAISKALSAKDSIIEKLEGQNQALSEKLKRAVDVLKWMSGGVSCRIEETPSEISPMGCVTHYNGFQCKASEALTSLSDSSREGQKGELR